MTGRRGKGGLYTYSLLSMPYYMSVLDTGLGSQWGSLHLLFLQDRTVFIFSVGRTVGLWHPDVPRHFSDWVGGYTIGDRLGAASLEHRLPR